MARIGIFLAEGCEEIEALAPADLCRRAGLEVLLLSVNGSLQVMGSHGLALTADGLMEDVDLGGLDMLVLPGGMPGTANLEACQPLMEQVDSFCREGKPVGAICAAPGILGRRGWLAGRRSLCYPGLEEHLAMALPGSGKALWDGHILTSRGMGTAMEFGLAIVERFCGSQAANALGRSICLWERE